MAESVVVAELGLEGGGVTILSTRVDGRWSFRQRGSSIALDGNDDEQWRAWESEATNDLGALLPDIWPLMYPMTVHPDFVGWFRDHYEAARARLDERTREYQAEWQDGRWQEVFAGITSRR